MTSVPATTVAHRFDPRWLVAALLVLAVALAPLLFRLDGATFAVGTWVAAETVMLVFTMIPSMGGGAGMSLPAGAVKAIAAGKELRETVIFWLVAGLSLAGHRHLAHPAVHLCPGRRPGGGPGRGHLPAEAAHLALGRLQPE